MKLLITSMAILLASMNSFAGETDESESKSIPAKVQACMGCHNKMVNLKGRGIETIISQTMAIKSSKKPHPPAGIKELSDEDIAAFAAFIEK
jgi:cytochrome c553